MKRVFKLIAVVAGAAAGCYAGYVALTYLRYGRSSRRLGTNALLDLLMPDFEVREVHHVAVRAPASVTLAAARETSFYDSPVIRSLFALRELPARLTSASVAPTMRRPIFEEVIADGWRVIGEEPGGQIILGAVTQPWRRKVEFHGLSPDEFTAFREPGYAKIAWTLEVDPAGPSSSVFRTETRVSTTDPASRERFRRYWSFLSPGIIIIRYEILRLVKSEAERRSFGSFNPPAVAAE